MTSHLDIESGVDYRAVHKAAMEAAAKAAERADMALGSENSRGFDCGFAWVQLTPGNHAFVRSLKAQGVGSKHWDKGWELWGSSLHGRSTQSISVHVAAANAYSDTIRAARIGGLDVSVGSRYD